MINYLRRTEVNIQQMLAVRHYMYYSSFSCRIAKQLPSYVVYEIVPQRALQVAKIAFTAQQQEFHVIQKFYSSVGCYRFVARLSMFLALGYRQPSWLLLPALHQALKILIFA